MQYKDYYKLLGVERSASKAEIKKAYRKLARKYHPDVSKEKDAEARFKEIGEAYEVLKDKEKRASYDQLGANWKAGQDFNPPPGWGGSAGGGFNGGGGASSFSDFFESMFGGGQFNQGGRRPEFRQKGQDQSARIEIDLEDSFHGVSKSITLGQPQGGSRTLSVKIPKGVKPGQKIRLGGQGMPGAGGGPDGDLLLEIQFRKHPKYRLEDKDIHMDLPISPWEAALGAKVTVPTLTGNIGLKVPEGSQSGRKMRLKGRGLPGKPDGDFYVHLKTMVPPAQSDEDKEFYNKMADHFNFNPRQ
ncbi:MAG: DnaJ C-terminal domain-containing protein [bacterium]